MLTTETDTLADARESLSEQIEAINDHLDDLDSDTDEARVAQNQRNQLRSLRKGVEWQIEEWGEDTEVTIGALTAGEEAIMDREVPNSAEPKERRLWYVAQATEAAPYVEDGLSETFANVADLHPGFVKWAEARSNALGVAGNRSSTSSTVSETSETSTPTPGSTT